MIVPNRNTRLAAVVVAAIAVASMSGPFLAVTAIPIGAGAGGDDDLARNVSFPSSSLSLSPLDCDAYQSSTTVVESRIVPASALDGTSRLDSSTMEGIGNVNGATQPPSVAPSMAPPCSDPLSNARGQYTSTMAPCLIKFHGISNQQREGQEEAVEEFLIDYHTSNLCQDSNIIVEIKEYLTAWPDECIGDFGRCYSLQHHFDLLWDFLCERQFPGQPSRPGFLQSYKPRWELPPGTTHISVECTIDKDLVTQASNKELKEHYKEVREARRQAVEGKLLNLIMVVLASFAIIVALSKFIITPLVTVALARRTDRTRRRSQSPSDGRRRRRRRTSRRSGSFRTATTRSTSGGSSSGSGGGLPMHHHIPQEQFLLLAHAESVDEVRAMGRHRIDGTTDNTDGADDDCDYDYDYSDYYDDDDDDDGYGSGEDGNHNNGSDISRQYVSSTSMEEDDFDSQIPADFDAVPIVPATILPALTLQATVVQDGISYT